VPKYIYDENKQLFEKLVHNRSRKANQASNLHVAATTSLLPDNFKKADDFTSVTL